MNRTDGPPRTFVYVLLIVVATSAAAGRIMATSRVYEPELTRDPKNPADYRGRWPAKRPQPMPTFSSNDRSRWATVRALVDKGTYAIGHRDKSRIAPSAVAMLAAADPVQAAALAAAGYEVRSGPNSGADTGIIFEDGWQSLDKLLDPETFNYYSTKPPLLSTLVAGLYWLLQTLFGWTLATEPFAVVRTLLIVVNLVPFVIYLALLARLADRYARSDWTCFFFLASAAFATLLTTFLNTFNNHTVATCFVLFALYPILPILKLPWQPLGAAPLPGPLAFAASGLFASFAVCNELPALAFAVSLFTLLVWQTPRQTLLYFVPAALIPAAGLLLTNYLALGDLTPAYDRFGKGADQFIWYQFEGSHWREPPPGTSKHGIDWAKLHESRAAYAFHVLIGHHGWLSLTPLWLLALAGMVWSVKCAWPSSSPSTSPGESNPGGHWPAAALMTLVVTAVVIGYYLWKSDNYGGNTSGLRWLMWLTPLWLLTMLPVVDWLAERRWGRWVAYVLLAWSVFSAAYPAWNPWRQPWLYNLLENGGYVAY